MYEKVQKVENFTLNLSIRKFKVRTQLKIKTLRENCGGKLAIDGFCRYRRHCIDIEELLNLYAER